MRERTAAEGIAGRSGRRGCGDLLLDAVRNQVESRKAAPGRKSEDVRQGRAPDELEGNYWTSGLQKRGGLRRRKGRCDATARAETTCVNLKLKEAGVRTFESRLNKGIVGAEVGGGGVSRPGTQSEGVRELPGDRG